MRASLHAKKGQNTAEYLIMLTLVVVSSIALWTMFGKTIQNKIAYVSAAISGDAAAYDTAQTQTVDAAAKANTKAKDHVIHAKGIESKDLSSGSN